MFTSLFDLFKIGIGPSSSHTVGPMAAAGSFLEILRATPEARHLHVRLHGSLAFTGKGHGTDRAICLGLCGQAPATVPLEEIEDILSALRSGERLFMAGLPDISFNPDQDLIFDRGPSLPGHPNGIVFSAYNARDELCAEETYYSIGGGFIVTGKDFDNRKALLAGATSAQNVPYPFSDIAGMLEQGARDGLTIAQMQRANEIALAPDRDLDAGIDRIWGEMNGCIERGLSRRGTLPGALGVKRRAAEIHDKLLAEHGANALQPHRIVDWLSVYAMAVNEENAAGGRVVTAPTNGAAGVLPAVARYYLDHCTNANAGEIRTFLLTAAAIGGMIKRKASISGAEVGCQGEVGSASSIAAAGLTAALGGTNAQIENAAEIALEHHLGMTCDPVGGLVQVPCIERNAFGAVKAVTAASLALRSDGSHFVSLDQCIETMRQTGLDMRDKYKETSTGGLAVNVVAC
jgi:L-serine dehydratase